MTAISEFFTQVDLGNGVYAGFTNRFGGVSEPPYDSLNLGPNVADDPLAVAANRQLVAEFIGAPVVFSSQVHGSAVIELPDAAVLPWLAAEPPVTAGEADALLTNSTQVGLGVLVADCVPILLAGFGELAGTGENVRLVATAHAGRRGVELNVISEVVAKMKRYGADRVVAAIGPAVCGKCYEVPTQMRADVAAIAPPAWAETSQGTPGLDLPAAAAVQLEAVGAKVVYRSPICTFEHPGHYSHRRATAEVASGGPGVTGRQAGIIRLMPRV